MQKTSLHTNHGFSHHLILPVLAILAVGGIGVYLTFGSRAGSLPRVRKTADFINSMGVAAHLGKVDSPYTKPGADIAGKAVYLGIKHFRTNAENEPTAEPDIRALMSKGVRVDFTTERPDPATTEDLTIIKQPIDQVLSVIGSKYAANTDSFELFNEMNGNGVAPANFEKVLKLAVPYAWDNSAAIRSRGVKVLAPSLVGKKLDKDAVKLGTAIGSTYFDYGNIHSYFSGEKPESRYPASTPKNAHLNFNKNPGTLTASNLDNRLQYYAYYISQQKPIIVTEMGYQPDWGFDDTYRMSGIYIPRAYLENFRIGVLRSYIYQLFDEGSGNGFGLFRDETNAFAAKPAANAIHNLTSLLGGGTTNFTPQSLAIRYSGDTAYLKTMLLQKGPGEYWLALWRDKSIYDTATKTAKTVTPTNITVTLPAARGLTYYTGLKDSPSPAALAKGTAKSTTVPVGAEVSLLKIK